MCVDTISSSRGERVASLKKCQNALGLVALGLKKVRLGEEGRGEVAVWHLARRALSRKARAGAPSARTTFLKKRFVFAWEAFQTSLCKDKPPPLLIAADEDFCFAPLITFRTRLKPGAARAPPLSRFHVAPALFRRQCN